MIWRRQPNYTTGTIKTAVTTIGLDGTMACYPYAARGPHPWQIGDVVHDISPVNIDEEPQENAGAANRRHHTSRRDSTVAQGTVPRDQSCIVHRHLASPQLE